jgi:hypothetical protein
MDADVLRVSRILLRGGEQRTGADQIDANVFD